MVTLILRYLVATLLMREPLKTAAHSEREACTYSHIHGILCKLRAVFLKGYWGKKCSKILKKTLILIKK